MNKHIEGAGFTAPTGHELGNERHTVALAALIATVALAISTIVAATVVSVGIARASVAGNVIDNEGSLFAVALLLGLLFIGMGGLTILALPGDQPKSAQDPQLDPAPSDDRLRTIGIRRDAAQLRRRRWSLPCDRSLH